MFLKRLFRCGGYVPVHSSIFCLFGLLSLRLCHLSVWLSACLSIACSVGLAAYMSVFLSVDRSVGLSVCLSVHQCTCLSVLCPSVSLSIWLFLWLSLLSFAPSKRKKTLWQLEVVCLLCLRGRIFLPYTKTAFRICSSLAVLSPPYNLQLWLICCVVVLDYTLNMCH